MKISAIQTQSTSSTKETQAKKMPYFGNVKKDLTTDSFSKEKEQQREYNTRRC